MENDSNVKKSCKIKDFFKSLAEKIDKKMQQKAKSSKGCCGDPKDNSCCK